MLDSNLGIELPHEAVVKYLTWEECEDYILQHSPPHHNQNTKDVDHLLRFNSLNLLRASAPHGKDSTTTMDTKSVVMKILYSWAWMPMIVTLRPYISTKLPRTQSWQFLLLQCFIRKHLLKKNKMSSLTSCSGRRHLEIINLQVLFADNSEGTGVDYLPVLFEAFLIGTLENGDLSPAPYCFLKIKLFHNKQVLSSKICHLFRKQLAVVDSLPRKVRKPVDNAQLAKRGTD